MFRTGWSYARIRRNAAIWLIGAWAVFGMSQALALCCVDIGSAVPIHVGVSDAGQDDGAADHHHCNEGAGSSLPSTPSSCPMDLGEAPPPAASAVSTLLQGFHATPLPSSMGLLPSAPVVERVRAPLLRAVQSPPHPIYLRLERFLI